MLWLPACTLDTGVKSKSAPADAAVDEARPDTSAPDVVEEECNGIDDDEDGLVDEGFPDDDENARVDCLDETCAPLDRGGATGIRRLEECRAAITAPWNAIRARVFSETSGVFARPVVAHLDDDNGDGLAGVGDVPDITYLNGDDSLVAIDGATGAARFTSDPHVYYTWSAPMVFDREQDGVPEILALSEIDQVRAVDADGHQLFRMTVQSDGWPPGAGGVDPSIADLDGDAVPELLFDRNILDGETMLGEAFLPHDETYRTVVAADLDLDGTAEVILGCRVYAPDASLLWEAPVAGDGCYSAVFDVDGDPEGEIAFATGTLGYIYDADGDPLVSFALDGKGDPGPPCVADFDGDGTSEVAIPGEDRLALYEPDGTFVWGADVDDYSGFAGCSAFDLDGNGASEVLFAGEHAFSILDGSTGTVLFQDTEHSSATIYEYPVIADIDLDGSAEVLVSATRGDHAGISVFEHAGSGWAGAGHTWPIHDFAPGRVNDDNSVEPLEPWWQTDNLFRSRPVLPDESAADLFVTVTDACAADCDYGPFAVSFQVGNQGTEDVPAGASVAVYVNGALIQALTLPAIPGGAVLEGMEITLPGSRDLRVVVDDDGTGVERVKECDDTNNVAIWDANPCG